uniref:NACHT domain-containing protein n=1 Tax=Strigamia maritima TaxID=126957 RepID=T1IS02_STRMM
MECVPPSNEGSEILTHYVAQGGPVYNIEVNSCGAFYAGSMDTLSAPSTLITNQDFFDLRDKLKVFYQDLTLPCIAWLDEAQDLNIDEFFIDLQLDVSNTPIKKEDIFDLVNQQQSTRILMEGQPGSGKTSLATRIAYDWAHDTGYVNNFQFVFLLPLRELQSQSVEDALKTIGKICGFKDSEKMDEIIASNEQHVLFIFDGLDELSVQDRESILLLLYKQKYGDATMLVTCRTGLFKLTKDEHMQLFKGIGKQSTFYNKKISILGIKNDDKKMEFLEKFIIADESVKQNVFADLKSIVTATQLFDCPLFLILLAFIVNTEEKVVTFYSTTELYKKLFNCIVKHSCVKNRIPLDDCFDLFDPFDCNLSQNEFREVIQEFGKLSLQHILENNLQFKSDSLTENIYKFGFLSHHKQVIRFRSNQYYEAFHLSIIEFSAAYYVWMEYKFNKSEFKDKLLKPVMQHYVRKRGTSLVLNFIIGLFEEHSCDIFDAIQPLSSCFSSNFHYTAQLIKEVSSPDVYERVFPSLIDFIPPYLDLRVRFRLEVLNVESFEKLMEYGVNCGKITSVYIKNLIEQPSLLKLDFQRIKTRLDKAEDLEYILTNLSSGVNELYVDISEVTKTSKLSTADIKQFVSTIATFKSKKCALKLYCYDGSYMNPELRIHLNDNIFETPIYLFSLKIETNLDIELVVPLLRKNQISVLKIYLQSNKLDLSDLFNVIANCTNLHEFMLISRGAVIDLSDLTNGGTKKYEYLELKNCIVNCKPPMIDRDCVQTLSIDGISSETLREIEPINLRCRTSDVNTLLEMNPTWPGVKSIKYINIHELQTRDIDAKCVLNFLSICKNLQTLEISSTVFNDAQILVEGLLQLEIQKFVYVIEDFKNRNLFKTLNNNSPTKISQKLQSIDIIYKWESMEPHSSTQSRNCISSEIVELMKGLRKQRWKRVNFICYARDCFLSLLNDTNIIDVSVFNVVHYLYGSDNNDPDYHKHFCKRNAFSSENAFAITKKLI